AMNQLARRLNIGVGSPAAAVGHAVGSLTIPVRVLDPETDSNMWRPLVAERLERSWPDDGQHGQRERQGRRGCHSRRRGGGRRRGNRGGGGRRQEVTPRKGAVTQIAKLG